MRRVLAILRVTYYILKIIGSLLLTWIIVSWNIRNARRSFEAEMTKVGVSKEDAQKLSECFMVLKKQIKNLMESSISLERIYREKH